MGDTVITEKGIVDKDRFYLPKSIIDKFANNTYRSIEEIL
jgi:hypothetical protein